MQVQKNTPGAMNDDDGRRGSPAGPIGVGRGSPEDQSTRSAISCSHAS